MSTPTDPPLDELRSLRERAYGRDADIQDDPDALARLRELEAQVSAVTPGVPTGRAMPATVGGVAPGGVRNESGLPSGDGPWGAATISPGTTGTTAPRSGITNVRAADGSTSAVLAGPPVISSATTADGGDSPAADTVASAAAHEDPSLADDDGPAAHRTAPRPPWWRRRTPMLWAASVAAGVLFGVGLTLAVQAAGAGRVATLGEDADAEWPNQFFGERPADALVFDDFYGLTVLTFQQPAQPGSAQTCLYIVTAPDAFGAGTCAADAFAPTASLEVGPASPDELRERFPRGTALQFVLDGSSVQVYAREPSLVEPTP